MRVSGDDHTFGGGVGEDYVDRSGLFCAYRSGFVFRNSHGHAFSVRELQGGVCS